MKYTKIILKGYKRLSLNHIDYIEITPQSIIQLILGTNGSGKSSLIKEISPLPAVPAEYHKEGYKHIELKHNGFHYTLKSTFGAGGNRFSFLKGDEELNPGGTSTVFKELVKKEFNYTPEIHELMTGAHNFHQMSVAERRNWFIKIPGVDYSYAIQYYSRLKEQHRDLQGAIKLSQSRLVQESEKLLTPEMETIQREEIRLLNELLNHLLSVKSNRFAPTTQVVSHIEKMDEDIMRMAKLLLNHRKKFLNLECFSSVEDIDQALIDTRASLNTHLNEVDKLCKEVEAKQNTLSLLDKNNVKSLEDVEKQSKASYKQIETYRRQLNLPLEFQDNKQAYAALMSVYDNLTEIFTNLPENKEKKYNVTDYENNQRAFKHRIDASLALNSKLQELNAKKKELEHLKTHGLIQCPECEHKWYQGYSEEAYQQNEKLIEAIQKDISYADKLIKEITEYLEACKLYLEYYRSYSQITNSWQILAPLWDYILINNIIFDSPRQIISVLESLKQDFFIHIKIEEEMKNLENNENLKKTLSNDQKLNIENLNKQIEDDQNRLYDLNSLISKDRNYIQVLQVYRNSAISIDKITQELESYLLEREVKTQFILDAGKQEAINEAIQKTRLELSQRENLISKIDIQKALVKNLQSQIDEMKDKVDLYSIAITELSPSEGLIAKSLTGFINHFVKQMNAFIKKIWLYPLEIVPIVPDEDGIDLDFKFEVRINDNLVIPDINKASSAMKEVIDLAFRVTCMPYLGLCEAPLFLDEPGANMDHSHRSNFNRLINELSISSNFSQVYMISHYHDSYGSFSNTDYVVLDSRNIKLMNNTAFNKNCVIK